MNNHKVVHQQLPESRKSGRPPYRLVVPAVYYPAGPKPAEISNLPCVLCGGRHVIGSRAAYRVEPIDPQNNFWGYAALECVKAARLK